MSMGSADIRLGARDLAGHLFKLLGRRELEVIGIDVVRAAAHAYLIGRTARFPDPGEAEAFEVALLRKIAELVG